MFLRPITECVQVRTESDVPERRLHCVRESEGQSSFVHVGQQFGSTQYSISRI